jgi:hypothetical protein
MVVSVGFKASFFANNLESWCLLRDSRKIQDQAKTAEKAVWANFTHDRVCRLF